MPNDMKRLALISPLSLCVGRRPLDWAERGDSHALREAEWGPTQVGDWYLHVSGMTRNRCVVPWNCWPCS